MRICMLSAGDLVGGVHVHPVPQAEEPPAAARRARAGGLICAELRPARAPRCKDMRNYPMALTFLLAYLFFNDGIQTVIASASTYGEKQLGFGTTVLIAHDPAGAVRRVRRRAGLRPGRRRGTAPSG